MPIWKRSVYWIIWVCALSVAAVPRQPRFTVVSGSVNSDMWFSTSALVCSFTREDSVALTPNEAVPRLRRLVSGLSPPSSGFWVNLCGGESGVRVQLKCDGTRWRAGGEVKGKLANGVGGEYSSHYLGTWCIQHYYRRCAHLDCQQSTELTSPAEWNGFVRLGERRNLVSAHVPSHFKRSLRQVFFLRFS